MIPINNNEDKIVSNFVGPETKFTLSSSRAIFDILRKGIYKDPIGSVIRELASNGRDAQRRKGNVDKPLDITLNNNYVVIRDYGTGMSVDTINTIYSCLGVSDKTSTNNEQGAFGIGAVSSLAVADSYTMETHWEGIKYTYLCYIDDSGSGAVKQISEESSNDEGTVIKIPISANRRYDFKRAIYKYTCFYSPLPRYLGELPPILPEVIIEGSCWRQYKDLSSLGNPNVICDGVPYNYNIDYSSFPENVVLICNVGDLEITASREELRKCDHNTNHLKKLYSIFLQERYGKYYELIKNESDYQKAILLLREYISINKDTKKFEWGGKEFTFPLKEHIKAFNEGGFHKYRPSIDYTFRNSGKLKPTHFLTSPGEIDNKVKRKLGYYWKENRSIVYFVPKDFIFPITCDINDVKIKYTNIGSGASPPRFIKARERGKKNNTNIPFTKKVIYTLDNIDLLRHTYMIGYVVQVEEKTLKRIKKYTDWLSLDEYIAQFGDKDQLAARGLLVINSSQIEEWSFLKDHVGPELKEILSFKSLSYETAEDKVCRYLACVADEEADDTYLTRKLFYEYPMLSNVYSYHISDQTKTDCINYVKLINERNK